MRPNDDASPSKPPPQPGASTHAPFALPQPTYWPFVMAASTCFALWGVLTSPWIVVVGVGGVLWAAKGWIGDVRDEPFE